MRESLLSCVLFVLASGCAAPIVDSIAPLEPTEAAGTSDGGKADNASSSGATSTLINFLEYDEATRIWAQTAESSVEQAEGKPMQYGVFGLDHLDILARVLRNLDDPQDVQDVQDVQPVVVALACAVPNSVHPGAVSLADAVGSSLLPTVDGYQQGDPRSLAARSMHPNIYENTVFMGESYVHRIERMTCYQGEVVSTIPLENFGRRALPVKTSFVEATLEAFLYATESDQERATATAREIVESMAQTVDYRWSDEADPVAIRAPLNPEPRADQTERYSIATLLDPDADPEANEALRQRLSGGVVIISAEEGSGFDYCTTGAEHAAALATLMQRSMNDVAPI